MYNTVTKKEVINIKKKRKLKKNDIAVSAIIGGVIIIVIITAIAVPVYFYVNGMIDSKESEAPNISFTADEIQNKIIVSKISASNVAWSDIIIGGNASNIEKWEPENQYVKEGQSINITVGGNPGDWCVITVLYKDRTIYGTYIFNK